MSQICCSRQIPNFRPFSPSASGGIYFSSDNSEAPWKKPLYHRYLFEEFYFWQDSNGVEIDLLWKNRDTYFATEIKATKTVQNTLFRQLDKFEVYMHPSPVKKTLLYGGNESQSRTHYHVVSWKEASTRLVTSF